MVKQGRPEVFVFIVGEQFRNSTSLTEYATVKTDLGYQVEYIYVTSQDDADSIRHQLQEKYARTDSTLAHALIIGDAEDVPGKESSIPLL